jgi:hypothetical protein
MGGGGSEQKTEIDPEFKPFMKFGLEEAKRLYEGMGAVPETLAVSPSEATQRAMMMAEQRALAGSPLTRQAQSTIQGMMTNYSPYEAGYQQMYGNAYTDPSRAFYEQLRGGQFQNEALGGVRGTASGAYLGGNPYLEGALAQSNRLSAEALQEGLRGLSSQTAAAGRMGSGAEQQMTGKAVDAAARAIAEANQQAYAQNYAQERGLQEQALARLGGLSQQDVANRLSGAQQLTSSGQQEFANRMAALAGAQGVYQQNLANQMAAAQFAPTLASQDYADIQRLLQVGQGREAYDQQAIEGRLRAQDIPLDRLRRTTNIFYGAPLETKTATSGGK